MREQELAARAAVISSNGWRVDVPKAEARVQTLATRREEILDEIRDRYGLPETGKAPWASKAGKEAIFAALADYGITPETRPDWPLTKKGAPSLGGEGLLQLTEGTEAEELGRALAELKGQRSLAQLALDSVHPDGFAHPDITMLQRSGRWSTTKPGLTIWTARGEGAIEKAYFIPDSEDEVLLEFDYSNADARVVASLSGDTEYAKRFEPGADGHMINAIAAWGEEVVATDPKGYRQRAKVPGHGWGYRVGATTLSKQTKMPFSEAKKFLNNMNAKFQRVVAWQDRCVQEAHRNKGFVTGLWGRRMPVEKDRAFTQAPALHGQNGTREIVCDAILRFPIDILRRVKAQIHDAIVFSVPRHTWMMYRDAIEALMYGEMDPPGGLKMSFPVEHGRPSENWYDASH
jgi:DNA polymerase-1